MLIGISSAQGQGKSTVLSSLSERGYKVINSQTSRKILDEWGTNLSEIESNPEMRMRFQEEVYNRHVQLIAPYANSSEIYFVERTFSDIFSYTVVSLGLYNEFNEWLNAYYNKCKEAQSQFTAVCILSGLNINDMDGVRSINKHFSNVISNTIRHFTYAMREGEVTDIIELSMPDHRNRIETIRSYVESKYLSRRG